MGKKRNIKFEARVDEFIAKNKLVILFVLGILIFVVIPTISKD